MFKKLDNKKENKMIIDIILGNTIDTSTWIAELQEKKAEHIIVVDFDFFQLSEIRDGILFMSASYAKEYTKKFDIVNFYKTFYGYPGMQGNMSSLFKRNKN